MTFIASWQVDTARLLYGDSRSEAVISRDSGAR
jgi:hypothetical protein